MAVTAAPMKAATGRRSAFCLVTSQKTAQSVAPALMPIMSGETSGLRAIP